ncbi:hypothetical protein [Deinococcus frigens]|uniref:hypothetical protein n=1 Tax=Deinococcus frigens TaxID=249403 RepID=UPI00054CFDAF|nr:hypothetical protein [Deinococcus frigens]
MHKWLSLLVLALAASAGAQDLKKCGGVPGLPAWARAGVYSGTVGPSGVTLGLGLPGDFPHRSFYAGQADDLFLAPFHQGNTLILQEEVRTDAEERWAVTGCFTLEEGAGAWRGSWKVPGKAAALKVVLKPLDVGRVPLKLLPSLGVLKLRRNDPLAFLKLNHPWRVTADGQSTLEPLTGLTYPRPAGASAALNSVLQDRLLGHAVTTLDCRSMLPQGTGSDGGGYEMRAAITLLTPRLLSLREDVGYYCGGAHPDSFTTGLILDRAKGRPISLLSLWPSLTPARLGALYLGASASDPASECDDVLRDMQDSFAVSLSSGGLTLTPDSLPHVVSACAESVVIPYGQLRRGANTGSPYFADLYLK